MKRTPALFSGIVVGGMLLSVTGLSSAKTMSFGASAQEGQTAMSATDSSSSARTSGALLIDDFDRGEKPNALGGDFGAWDKDPNDPTQGARNSFDRENAYGKVGYALRLDYDVDSPNPAYNGFWSKLQNLDARPYRALVFYVKGDAAKGFTTQLKLELKNDHETGHYVLKGITDSWQKVVIPFNQFTGLTDVSKLTEWVVVFDDLTATKKVGTLYLDDVMVE